MVSITSKLIYAVVIIVILFCCAVSLYSIIMESDRTLGSKLMWGAAIMIGGGLLLAGIYAIYNAQSRAELTQRIQATRGVLNPALMTQNAAFGAVTSAVPTPQAPLTAMSPAAPPAAVPTGLPPMSPAPPAAAPTPINVNQILQENAALKAQLAASKSMPVPTSVPWRGAVGPTIGEQSGLVEYQRGGLGLPKL
jgi:hypothetical protein